MITSDKKKKMVDIVSKIIDLLNENGCDIKTPYEKIRGVR